MTKIVGSLIGHKARCFDVRVLQFQGSNFVLSSSEDGTAILWNLEVSKRPIFIFKPAGDTEVLRSTFVGNTIERVCTCDSNGNVTVWRKDFDSEPTSKLSYTIEATLSHGPESQIYACESLLSGGLVTGADNCILLWRLGRWKEAPVRYSFADPHTCLLETPRINAIEGTLTYEILHTHKFALDNADVHNENGAPFGGPRNAVGHLLVFDVKVNPASPTVVALATSSSQVYAIDISMGLLALNGDAVRPCDRGGNVSSNALFSKTSYCTKIDSASNNYITSLCWHSNGTLMLAAMGHGQIVLLDMLAVQVQAFHIVIIAVVIMYCFLL